MQIYCAGCKKTVNARLTSGQEIYPHRSDLYSLPFWKCDACHNYVGCHHKTSNSTRPLGCIPTREIMEIRKRIHAIIDPLWRSKKIARGRVYRRISEAIGREYHTGEISSVEDANQVLSIALSLARELAQ